MGETPEITVTVGSLENQKGQLVDGENQPEQGKTVVDEKHDVENRGQELTERYNKIHNQIAEIGKGKDFDKIDGVRQEMLNGEFVKFLFEHPEALKALKASIKTIKDNKLDKRAGKEVIKELSDFLDNLANSEKLEKDYKKFVEKLAKPKDLHKMKENEVERVKLYLSIHEDDALRIYKYMREFLNKEKPTGSGGTFGVVITLSGTGMDLKDINVFQGVWECLRDNYGSNDKFITEEYVGYDTLVEGTSANLKNFIEKNRGVLGVEWDGEEITEAYIGGKYYHSIIDKKRVAEKLQALNQKRIDGINVSLEALDINISDEEKKHFTKKDGVLKYDGVEFTKYSMLNFFKDEIEGAVQGYDFVSDNERDKLIHQNIDKEGDTIFTKFRDKLLADSSIQDEVSQPVAPDPNNGNTNDDPEKTKKDESENEKQKSTMYEAGPGDVRIKDKALKKAITTDLKFCDSLEKPVKFDIAKVREYLDSIKEKKWGELNKKNSLDKKKWTIAVQIALNYLNSLEGTYNGKCSVTWIDGIYKKKTTEGVLGFQKAYNESGHGDKIKEDGKAGPQTISAIVSELDKVWTGGNTKLVDEKDIGKKEQKEVEQKEVKPEDLVEGLPEGADVEFKEGETVDTSKPGTQIVTVIVKQGGEEIAKVKVKVTINDRGEIDKVEPGDENGDDVSNGVKVKVKIEKQEDVDDNG